jgi:cell division protein FtsI/penicillin-binding protein 2
MAVSYSEKQRTLALAGGLLVWTAVILGTLFKVQLFDYGKYIAKIKAQTQRTETLHSKRGTIFDRNGEILAISVDAKSAFISNKSTASSLDVFGRVRRLLKMSGVQIAAIRRRIRRGERFIWLKRRLNDSEYEALRPLAAAEPGRGVLDFIDEYRRVYPQRRTACHVLGGVGVDEQALAGVEYGLDKAIRGRGGEVEMLIDARKKIFQYKTLRQPQAGQDIRLTIDSSLQFFVERALQETVDRYRARGGAVVVLDSRDASLLALASYPDYLPEEIGSAPADALRNRAISFLYDPGSTFKVVLAAGALENNICYPQQIFNCGNGVLHVRDCTITDVHPYSDLSFEDIIVHSSNIGAAKIGMRMGSRRYYEIIRRFGLGERTGVDLPAEERGILNPLARWSDVSLAFLSFGYEISVTPLQMACVFNAIAARGQLMKPHAVLSVGPTATPAAPAARILSSATEQRLMAILRGVVQRGTGTQAAVPGLDIAGKTGTTKKIRTVSGEREYVSSFGGFFPAGSPLVTVFVIIDSPEGQYYGGDVAAPLFRSIVEKIIIYLRLLPKLNDGNEIRL